MNPMHYVTVHDIQVLSMRQVVFIIDLDSHVHLKDPTIVQVSMDAFTLQYHPRVEEWEANARGGWLYIKVTGDINPAAFARFSE